MVKIVHRGSSRSRDLSASLFLIWKVNHVLVQLPLENTGCHSIYVALACHIEKKTRPPEGGLEKVENLLLPRGDPIQLNDQIALTNCNPIEKHGTSKN